jgi:hypothetical protein
MPPRQSLFHDIEKAIAATRDQESFIQRLLIDALGWEIDQAATDIEDISFDWSASDLRAEGLDQKIADGTIRQLRPMADNPWGIFLIEFKHPDAFTTGRGMTGPLRRILRGLVPSKRKASGLASFKREHLLFLCTHAFQHYRFAYFKAPPKATATAPLAAFGWGPGDGIRTLCQFNLPELAWPHPRPAADDWIAAWSRAFDVEKVTKRFYEDYAAVFESVEGAIARQNQLSEEDLRLFTQTLFNRLMFLRFIERKGWLEFDGRHDYLRALFAAPAMCGKSFYTGRLQPLFFKGLAIEGEQESDAIGRVPFLNGGLFESTDLDAKVNDISDAAFESIVGRDGLFYRYNFTVEESTPLDIEVAVDPEMLGKVFEELVTGRHESGSYYTPRPVVAFMCREGLKGILMEKTKSPAAAIARFVDSHEVKGINETQAREILKALDDLKAVDPACGSGAYLLGLLHEMVALYRLMYSEKVTRDSRSLFELKLRILSQNLYGVDSDPFATNIAMLRLWLSLAVEADGPQPLPNLDFKIETGDSLLAPDPSEMPDLLRGILEAQAKSLINAKNQYLRSHGAEKEEYRKCIKAGEERLRNELKMHHGEGVVDWRIQFAEVFAFPPRGFDLVLANPPYVRKENIDATAKPALRTIYAGAVTGQSDLYCYFYARGLQLLRRGGVHIFICSNSWLDSGYGAVLQEYLLRNAHVIAVYDSAVERQFATADINTIISVIRKQGSPEAAETRFVVFNAPFVAAIADPSLRRETNVGRSILWGALRNGKSLVNGSYSGGKWGGRYLRSPDIYRSIVEKVGDRLQPLASLARVDGYIHDNNTGGTFPRRRFLKSVKDAKQIKLTEDCPGVVLYGVKQEGNSSLKAPILFPRTFGERHIVLWNIDGVYGKEFYKVIPSSEGDELSIVAQLNSTFGILQRELLGLVNLGDGAIKFSANDVGLFQMAIGVDACRLQKPFQRLACREWFGIERELTQPDRREVDAAIFDALGLESNEREELYDATARLVRRRLAKADAARR